jgi:hypothetical protein
MIPTSQTTKPKWPAATFQELVKIAFAGRLIDSADHCVVRRLRGLD